MKGFISAWAEFVIAKRAFVIAATVLLLPLVLFTGGSIPFDNSTERYFVSGDPTLEEYNTLLDLFGDNEYLIVGIAATGDSADVFTPEALDALIRLSEFLEFHPYVTQLRSLTTYQYLRADGDDLSTNYLIDDYAALRSDPREVQRLKDTLREEDLALDTLVTPDFRHVRMAARVEHREDTSAHKVELAQDLYRFVEQEDIEGAGFELHLSGYPLVNERFETVSAQDTALLVPIMVVVMMLILFFSFRSIIATLLPWLVIASGLLLVLEIQYYLGIPHTTIDSGALPPTLIIIGIGITVHVLLEFFHFNSHQRDGKVAAATTIRNIWMPAFFTAITTSAGFLALSVTRIQPMREFALLGAIGPLLLFLFALTVLPAMLSYIKELPQRTSTVVQSGVVTRLTDRVPDFTRRFRKPILVAGLIIVAFTLWNLPNAEIDNNYVTLFKESSQTRQDIEYFDDVWGGMMTLDIILDSGAAEGIKEPEFLRDMESVQTWLAQRPSLGKINSLVDYLKEINQALHQDNPDDYRLPETNEMAAQYLLLYSSAGTNEDLSDLKGFDNRHTRLIAPVVNMPASVMQEELDAINAYLQDNYAHLSPLITGTMVLYTVQDMYVAEGTLLSFLVALAVISLFFIILFRSVRYGLLSIIPSVLPILLTASIAGFLGIYLDQSSVIVFAMTMGIAVDDAIHVMSRYLLYRRRGESTHEAIARAMKESGRAVVFSSMILVCGFSVLCFASFTTIIYVGLFGSIIMALALLGDLIFLPAILYSVDNRSIDNNKVPIATQDKLQQT